MTCILTVMFEIFHTKDVGDMCSGGEVNNRVGIFDAENSKIRGFFFSFSKNIERASVIYKM